MLVNLFDVCEMSDENFEDLDVAIKCSEGISILENELYPRVYSFIVNKLQISLLEKLLEYSPDELEEYKGIGTKIVNHIIDVCKNFSYKYEEDYLYMPLKRVERRRNIIRGRWTPEQEITRRKHTPYSKNPDNEMMPLEIPEFITNRNRGTITFDSI